MLILVALALLSQTPTPTPTTTATPKRPKVLVLDTRAQGLGAGEAETLTSLVVASLGKSGRLDVVTGEDLRRLSDLESQKQEAGCDDASCMSQIAGALNADVVVSTQAGRLGALYIVSLGVFDGKTGAVLARRPLQAKAIEELPELLGPVLDELVLSLAPPPTTTTKAKPLPPPPQQKKETELSPRVRELYGRQAVQICIDKNDKSVWWFCDTQAGITENDFVRRHRALVGADPVVDAAEVGSYGAVGASVGVGVGALAVGGLAFAWLACGLSDCSDNAILNLDGDGSPAVGPAMIGAMGVIGGILCFTLWTPQAVSEIDGPLREHRLREGQARAAMARYNRALLEKFKTEFGD